MNVKQAKEAIMQMYPTMIGAKNAISIYKIYEFVFGKKYDGSKYAAFDMHFIVRRALHSIRTSNKYCIVPVNKNDNKVYYCVPNAMSDLTFYFSVLKQNIKGCQENEKKALAFVKEKKYLEVVKYEPVASQKRTARKDKTSTPKAAKQ